MIKLTILLSIFSLAPFSAQTVTASYDEGDEPIMIVTGKVIHADYSALVLSVDGVVAHSRTVTHLPQPGDEITIRIADHNKPTENQRIEMRVLEKVKTGAIPSAYMMLNFRTLQ